MFNNCKNFNQPLDSWDVSRVIHMRCMFDGSKNVDMPLNKWNISSVKNM